MASRVKRTGSRMGFILKTLLVLSVCGINLGSTDSHWLDLLSTVQHLPVENLEKILFLERCFDIHNGRQELIEMARDIADSLETRHVDETVVSQIGPAGDYVLLPSLVGELIRLTAAPIYSLFTKFTKDIANYYFFINSLASIEEELKRHREHLLKFSSDFQYLKNAAKFRSTLEKLGKLSIQEWGVLITTIQKLAQTDLRHNEEVEKLVNQVAYPAVKELLQQLPLLSDSKSLQALSDVCVQILKQIHETKDAIEDYLMFVDTHGLTWLEKLYTGSGTAHHAFEITSVVENSQLAKKADQVVDILSPVRMFNATRMLIIYKETGETTIVEQLRKMADDLGKEFPSINTAIHHKDSMQEATNRYFSGPFLLIAALITVPLPLLLVFCLYLKQMDSRPHLRGEDNINENADSNPHLRDEDDEDTE